MKKLMFTAIAMIAFSSASMANTIADEENTENKSEVIQRSPCLQIYMDTYDEFVELGFEDDASGEAWAAYRECVYASL